MTITATQQKTDGATLAELVELSAGYDSRKVDFRVPAIDVSYSMGSMVVPMRLPSGEVVGHELVGFEDGALEQAAGLLGIPPRYLLDCSPELRSANMQEWQERRYGGDKKRKSQEWFVRGWRDPITGEINARAVLTGEYKEYGNTEFLKVADHYIAGSDVQIVRPWVSRDGLYVKILAYTPPDDPDYAWGVVLKHGETGNYQVAVAPFLQRHSCENSIVWSDGGFTHKHRWVSQAWLNGTIMEKIGAALRKTAMLHERMVAAAMESIPSFASVVNDLCKKHGLNGEMHDAVLVGSEGKQTVQGLVNGLSFAAHRTKIDTKDTMRLEEMAGNFLMAGVARRG